MKRNRASEWDSLEWRRTKRAVLYRDNYHCLRCNRRFPSDLLTAHHIQTRAHGWKFEKSNLVTLCNPCHDIVEIYHFENVASIIGSFPVPPPELQEWIDMKDKTSNLSALPEGQPVYGILYLDNNHCLKCGGSGETRRMTVEYKENRISVLGFCFLCQNCSLDVSKRNIKTIPEIVGETGMRDLHKESSLRIEVFNHEFYILLRQPNWIKEKFTRNGDFDGSNIPS